MATKTLSENPTTTDTIILEIDVPDADDCLVDDPYKIDKLIIYYVERNFFENSYGEYEQQHPNSQLVADLEAAQKALCDDPSVENAAEVERLRIELEASTFKTTWYYKDRVPVKVVGTENFPAWLSTDTDNALLVKVEEDEDGNPLFGKFTYEWSPAGGVREGQYFVCWTWTPLIAGGKLSAHIPFSLLGDNKAVTTLPSHATQDDKYETLLERYLPEVCKTILCEGDLTPETTLKFNNSVAAGFTVVENFANQIIDLFDANVLHESLLVYLSNLFNLKLKSEDPTLWRRQIKQAVPLFKEKGTYGGLEEAFAQAGMALNGYTQFWQIVSPYTYEESFKVTDSAVFKLAKSNVELPIDEDYFSLWLRRSDEDEYVELNKDYVELNIGDNLIATMTWIGDELSVNPITLLEGDVVRVKYEFNKVPNFTESQVEEYIQTLPVADQRDEMDMKYPVKNWNVKLIEKDDPMFDILVPVTHPFHDDVIFGMVRTEFPYGENIYNMEEYNGSTRPSTDPCNIDKDFVDPCGSCLSSIYSVDVEIENLSNDRMLEAQDVLDEYMPFHAQLRSINFSGEIEDFVQPPVEQIDFLVNINRIEIHLSGQANPLFNRVMKGGMDEWIVNREDLTDQITVASKTTSTAYNSFVAIVAPGVYLKTLGAIMHSERHVVEVLAPSTNSGTYRLKNIDGHTAEVIPVSPSTFTEPIDESQFTFQITNILYDTISATITEDNAYRLSDDTVDYSALGVKTQWDIENTPDYAGGSWKISIPAYSPTPYEIEKIEQNVLYLDDDGTLPNPIVSPITSVDYSILDDSDNLIATSSDGVLDEDLRAIVDLNDPSLEISEVSRVGDMIFYDGDEYDIVAFDDQDVIITGYSDGNVAGATVEIRRRLIEDAIGQFGYQGLNLETVPDHEAEFSIVNGSNPPVVITDDNNFKENYMFQIDDEFFKILEWDGNYVKLSGRGQTWTTLDAGGTNKAYKLVHFPKKQVNIQFTVFDHLDRDGHDPVIRSIEADTTEAIVALSSGSQSGVQENVSQDEVISFVIQRRDGQTEEGEL